MKTLRVSRGIEAKEQRCARSRHGGRGKGERNSGGTHYAGVADKGSRRSGSLRVRRHKDKEKRGRAGWGGYASSEEDHRDARGDRERKGWGAGRKIGCR